jgi:hypothetical protein
MDRVVQASLVLVLEPIFEADFKPVSYGFRPGRRTQDAIAEIHALGSRQYLWVFEADIAACFDELAHSAVLDRVRMRLSDKQVLAEDPNPRTIHRLSHRPGRYADVEQQRPTVPDEADAIATIHAALDAGVTPSIRLIVRPVLGPKWDTMGDSWDRPCGPGAATGTGS